MSHTLAIVTVVYRNYTILSDYFKTFDAQTDPDFRIYVVDLSDEKKDFDYPRYVTYIPGKNKGYAHGANLGIHQALNDRYNLLTVMNCDVEVPAQFVEKLKKSIISHPQSLMGGKIYYGAGYEYHKTRYTQHDLGNVLWYAGGINDWENCTTNHRGVDEVDHGQFDRLEKTDFITGCLMAYDAQVALKLGLWDEEYFLYYEDADYCERAKHAGIALYYDPSVILWHKNAQSTGGSGSNIHTQYQKKNRLRFGLKYAPLRTKIHLIKNEIGAFLNSLCKCDE